jgi:hypothetical protein
MKMLAAKAAQYGANLGQKTKIDAIGGIKRKPFEPVVKRKPFDAKPKPGEQGFKAKSASDVVNSVAAMRRSKPIDKPVDKPVDNTVGVYGQGKVTNSKGQGNKFRGPENKKAKEEEIKKQREALKNGTDLFDIVKGQLLDEGLSEEEIKDIMLTLTPDEILKEMEDKPMEVNVADAKANTPAYQNYMSGKKRKTDGKPMYTASQDMKDRARGLK